MNDETESHASSILPLLEATIEELEKNFYKISDDRKAMLIPLASFISQKVRSGEIAQLNFICTHNSRRSHIAQLWAQAAATHYEIPRVGCFSGGTEATEFNSRAVKAMQNLGFNIAVLKQGNNPVYDVYYSTKAGPVSAFSKKYDDLFNPATDFAAIMTCSHADENCPFIPGAAARFAIAYDDPKEFDGTALESAKYDERARAIGTEILFVFSLVSSNAN